MQSHFKLYGALLQVLTFWKDVKILDENLKTLWELVARGGAGDIHLFKNQIEKVSPRWLCIWRFLSLKILGYRITKVQQLKEEEGRGKDTHQHPKFGGMTTTPLFWLDCFWLRCSSCLSTSHGQGTELFATRLSEKMRITCHKWVMNFALLALPELQFSFFIGLEYLEERKAGHCRRRLGRFLEGIQGDGT